jgi:hypothetical protein
MQTEMTKTETDNQAPTDEQIARAKAHLDKLRAAAGDADADADRWQTAFEREPTAQAHTNAAVAAQKAKNARVDVETFERVTLQPLLANQRRAEIAKVETAVLAQQKAAIDELDGAFATLVEAIERLDNVIGTFTALHYARHDARQKGVGLGAFTLQNEIQRLSNKLQRFGGAAGHHSAGSNGASVELVQPLQPEAHIAIRVARKAAGIPLPMRAQ